MTPIEGFEVVCPDGRVRHYPYHNEDDAICDAEVFAEQKCSIYPEPSPLEKRHPPCPEGKHTVRAIEFQDPTRTN
jgi:hypothetical protein